MHFSGSLGLLVVSTCIHAERGSQAHIGNGGKGGLGFALLSLSSLRFKLNVQLFSLFSGPPPPGMRPPRP